LLLFAVRLLSVSLLFAVLVLLLLLKFTFKF
jgi:hypothetical protein